MAGLFQQGGVNFDQLFDPDVMGNGPSVANMRAGGEPLRYAVIQYGSKRADVGYRVGGSDVSNLWAAAGTAQYDLPFQGAQYSTFNQAQTGQGGLITSVVSFTVGPDGNFNVIRGVGEPSSGSILLGGGQVSEYSYRIVVVSSTGTVNNGAASIAAVGAGTRTLTVTASGPAASANEYIAEATLRFELFRNGNLSSQTDFGMTARAFGWQ